MSSSMNHGPQCEARSTREKEAAKRVADGVPEGAPASKKPVAVAANYVAERVWSSPKPEMLMCDYGAPHSEVVYGFDMDDTLISTKSGKTFAANSDDWKWWHDAVPGKLREFAKAGAKLVIFTNQKGFRDKSTKELTDKIDKVQRDLGTPFLVLAALGNDGFRKPRTGLWDLLVSEANGGIAPDLERCRFVGDAAGRPALKKVKKDFSDTDLKFALNLGVAFQTPEECFLGPEAATATGRPYSTTTFAFDPRSLGKGGAAAAKIGPSGKQELIVVVGPPGSGKSSMATAKFPGYARANQDTLKTKEKCIKAVADALKAGKSAIVDNQNKDKATRKGYLNAAKAAGVPARAVLLEVPKELCFHLNCYRFMNKRSPEHRAETVPDMVIHGYFKNVEPPTKEEGFADVLTVTMADFEPRGSEEDIALMKSFLC
uniref:Polynucleotide kinase 3'-phosphatase n=1 Tax=Pyrodinium bahamense TaxID=73915 RepID=A0A7S0FJC5_9DINO|mmetsp:Transcript_33963/g.94011  ORF Transcript_33963/g.94011 Transcript_33963/m.94011 type:complete len:430 (+) Transcript_33963:107-1396(+)